MTYTATNRKTDETITVRGNDYNEAANRAAKRFCGSRAVSARRATGDNDKSGVFAAYKYDSKINAYNHQGVEFHLSEN